MNWFYLDEAQKNCFGNVLMLDKTVWTLYYKEKPNYGLIN